MSRRVGPKKVPGAKTESGKEYYEIRLESIGGLGANLCGKMLGELGVKYLDLNSSSFSGYGSEKTGTPLKSHIRYCKKEKEIRVHFPVEKPDLLVIFHQALLKEDSVWRGCDKDTAVIIAVENEASIFREGDTIKIDEALSRALRQRKGSFGQCFVIPAQKIATFARSRMNVVMLGATLFVMGIKDIETGRQICIDTLGKKYPEALENNLLGMEKGFREVQPVSLDLFTDCEDSSGSPQNQREEWGYENAPIGGVNPDFGSTVTSDLSPSRQGFIPIFVKERCINCGLCHSTCPDMVFQFVKGEYKGRKMMVNQGLDYYHCKGCLRCVDVCPVNALIRGVEADHPRKEHFLANQELLYHPDYYEQAGADGYITSESFLTEKRMEGGEV